jgi:hypothetical protein
MLATLPSGVVGLSAYAYHVTSNFSFWLHGGAYWILIRSTTMSAAVLPEGSHGDPGPAQPPAWW